MRVRSGNVFVDPKSPDLERFPEFASVSAAFEDQLFPGEVLCIPSGWFHDVVGETDSISVTWNFVHAARRKAFLEAVEDTSNDFDRDMSNFFFAEDRRSAMSLKEIQRIATMI